MNNSRKPRALFRSAEFQSEHALSKELPYWDFLEEDGCIVLADGTLVKGFALQGVAVETMDANQVNNLTSGLRSFLNSLPDGLDLQFFVRADSDFSDLIDRHDQLKGSRSLLKWISDGRVADLRRDMEGGALQRLSLYLFVYHRIATVNGGISSFFEKPRRFATVRQEEHEKRLGELNQLCYSIAGNLTTVGIGAAALTVEQMKGLVYATLNPTRSRTIAAPMLSHDHRNQEFTPSELAIEPALTLASPREQVIFSDLIQGVDGLFLDGEYHRVITLKTLPENTHSCLVSRLLTLPFHYTLSVQVRVPEQSKELSSLQARRRMAHSMSATTGGRASDLESEAKLHSTEDLLREIINTGQKIFYFQTVVLLKCPTLEGLELMTKAALSRFREINGAEALAETVANLKVFKTILPAGNTTTVRSRRVKSDNLADFLPVFRPWPGDARPVCIFRNRSGGLVSYDPSSQNLGNYNVMVTGSSGSGKSFLNNCILVQSLTQNPLTYIIDIGGSYRKLCEFMGGQYIEVSPPLQKGDISLQTINPFLIPSGTTEPSPQKIKFLISLLETILTDEEGDKLPKLDKSLLEEALIETYARTLPSRQPRFSDLVATLEARTEKSMQDYARMLYPWTGDRPYGRLLDAENALELTADMVVFDLKSLAAYPDLQSAMILIITDYILGKVDEVKDRRKQILMDECWELLKSRGARSFMEYCVRTLRKTGSGITFITQGLEEIERSAIGPAILNSTETKIILKQGGDLEPICKILKLNDQERTLISSLRQQKGSYSEAFLIAGENRSVIRIKPTPVEYWLATSDAADNALLQDARRRYPEKKLPEIIHWLASNYPNGSGGVTTIGEERKAA